MEIVGFSESPDRYGIYSPKRYGSFWRTTETFATERKHSRIRQQEGQCALLDLGRLLETDRVDTLEEVWSSGHGQLMASHLLI